MILGVLLAFGLGPVQVSEPRNLVAADWTTPISEVATFPRDGVLFARSALPLHSDTRAALEGEFQDGMTYFGAFAIGKDGSYGYVWGANSLAAARDIAREECLKFTDACLIYAEIHPRGYQEPGRGVATMAPDAAEFFESYQSQPQFYAMAISEDGAYAIVWGHATQGAADRAAMSDCNSYRITDLPDLRDMPCILLPLDGR